MPLTETSDAVLNGVLSNQAINELPLQGRDFQNLLGFFHPGVQRSAGGGFHSTTSNGLRPDDNNYIIDGANDNDAYYGETAVNDAGIQGYAGKHPTSGLDPGIQYPGTAASGFWRQARCGGEHRNQVGMKNQLHGTAYYFHRNAAFDARNYFNPSPQATSALLLHQFGAQLEWSVNHYKWFYFVNYEGVRSKVGNPFNVFTPVTTSLATVGQSCGKP